MLVFPSLRLLLLLLFLLLLGQSHSLSIPPTRTGGGNFVVLHGRSSRRRWTPSCLMRPIAPLGRRRRRGRRGSSSSSTSSTTTTRISSLSSSLRSSWSDDDYHDSISNNNNNNDDGGGKAGPWQLDNSFEHFLNQCALQSFLFLMASLKDRHTALWLEDFVEPLIHQKTHHSRSSGGRIDSDDDRVMAHMASAVDQALSNTKNDDDAPKGERSIRLLNYHGLGAINTTKFSTWDSLFELLLQEDSVVYQIESTQRHVPTYTLEIDPASLSRRLLSVRAQIGREFVRDLDMLAEISLTQIQKVQTSGGGSGSTTAAIRLDRPNLLFLEEGVDDVHQNDQKPSPLRQGNFDLLLTLTTQEAIHRILNRGSSVKADGKSRDDGARPVDDDASVQFLRNFYAARIGTHFTGSTARYNRAVDFLDELLQTPPSVVQLQDELVGRIDDPARLVARILKEREIVANEWLELSLDVPDQHMSVQKMQLNRQVVGQPRNINTDIATSSNGGASGDDHGTDVNSFQ